MPSSSPTSISAVLSASKDWRNLDNLIPLDFETNWSTDYSLSKIATSEYVRDERFYAHGMAIRLPEHTESIWVTHDDIPAILNSIDWSKYGVLCHNTQFDAFILHEHYNIHPAFYADTKSMSRANFGTEVRHSLNDLSARLGIGQKIEHTLDSTKGIERLEPAHELQLAQYAVQDNELCIEAFKRLILDDFPLLEMHMIDMSIRMFCEPKLFVDPNLVVDEVLEQETEKEFLMNVVRPLIEPVLPAMGAKTVKDVLMSNDKLAALLVMFDIDPPTKISQTTGKETWAFAKSDEGLQDLLDDPVAKPIIEARLAVKSTLKESRAKRMLKHGVPGPLPICLNHWSAHTGRHGGCDKLNPQNLPSKRTGNPRLRHAIIPPKGMVICTVDSRQGEARTLASLVGQQDKVEAFEDPNREVYSETASRIYGFTVDPEEHPVERFMGKTADLGLGYRMGSKKFVAQVQIAAMLSGMEVDFDLPRSMEVVDAWRAANPKYVEAWEFFDRMIPFMRSCGDDQIEEYGPITFTRNKIWLPNDCAIWYSQMQGYETAYGVSWKVLRRKRWQNLHGGVIAENLTQALHRQAVFEQALLIAQEFDVVMMTHDEVSYIAPEAEADAALAYGLQCMAVRPAWMPNLPLEGEGGYDTKYSK